MAEAVGGQGEGDQGYRQPRLPVVKAQVVKVQVERIQVATTVGWPNYRWTGLSVAKV